VINQLITAFRRKPENEQTNKTNQIKISIKMKEIQVQRERLTIDKIVMKECPQVHPMSIEEQLMSKGGNQPWTWERFWNGVKFIFELGTTSSGPAWGLDGLSMALLQAEYDRRGTEVPEYGGGEYDTICPNMSYGDFLNLLNSGKVRELPCGTFVRINQ
jgi:hypothetical protein